MKTIIGISGNAGVGKTTVARVLAAKHGAKILPFAEPMKKELMQFMTSKVGNFRYIEFHESMLYGTQEQKDLSFTLPQTVFSFAIEKGISLSTLGELGSNGWITTSGRKLMQWWGTDYRRSLNPYYWNEKWIEVAMATKQSIIADDIRHLDEVELVAVIGGCNVKIVGKSRGVNAATLAHASEQQISSLPSSFTIHNNSTLEHLYSNATLVGSYIFQGALNDSRAAT